MARNLQLVILLFAGLQLQTALGASDYFKVLEEELKSLKDRLSARMVSGDFEYGKDSPKSISIHCPCKESPVVSVKDLDVVDMDQECLQVKITGSNFEFAFSVNCDGESAGRNMHSSSSGDSEKSDVGEDDIEIEPDL